MGDRMKCQDVQKTLSPFQDGELKPKDQDQVAKHLQGCPACQEEFAKLERVWQALEGLPEIQPEPDFYGQLIKKINKPYEHRPLSGFREVFQLFSSVAGCTLLIAGVLIGAFLGSFLAGSDLFSFRPTMAGKSPEAVEVVSFRVFDPVPPGTLGDGYMRMVSNTEIQHK
jgi:anti-sigma factor RsiW